MPPELISRTVELDELTGFCGGDEAYAWWQGRPWAGKTALTSWFVLRHRPLDTDVVSFFVARQWRHRNNSGAFATAIGGQLAELLGVTAPEWGAPGHGAIWRLLGSASTRAWEAGRRLLMVVDGLDEDRSTEMGLHSIASYLPLTPPDGLRVLVTGRPNLGLPADLRANHPLRSVRPRMLIPSTHATRIAEQAQDEMRDLLGGSSAEHTMAREVAGCVAVAGGGLTRSDVEQLTGLKPIMLDSVLGGGLARSLEERGPDRVLLFAHDTLRVTALQLLGGATAQWARIVRWADEYAKRGWPADTPDYLLRRYVTQLIEVGDIARAAACTADTVRHERLHVRRGGRLSARTETAAVLRALGARETPDLTSMARVAAQWRPPTSFPTDLPAAWLLLGESEHGDALLEDMTDYEQIAALCKMIDVAAIAEVADRAPAWGERAASLAAQQVHPLDRIGGLRQVVRTVAAAGLRALAARIVDGTVDMIGNVEDRRFVELGMVEGLIRAGDVDEAVRRTFSAPVPTFAHRLLRDVGCLLASGGHISVAERVLADLPDARLRLPVRAAIGTALLENGRATEAFAVAASMFDEATAIEVAAAAACDLVERLAAVEPDQARALANRVAAALDPLPEHSGDGAVVDMLFDVGRHDIVDTMAVQGRAFPVTRHDLVKVGEGYAAAGQVDDALRITHLLVDNRERRNIQATLACAAARAGRGGAARALAAQVERDAQQIVDPSVHAANLEPLARSLETVGARDRALDVVRRACVAALQHTTEYPRTTPARLAESFIQHRLPDLAEVAAAAAPEADRSRIMTKVAVAMAAAGRFTDAIQLAAGHSRAATEVLTAALPTGRLIEAEDCLRALAAERPPPAALAALAQAYHKAGELKAARRLALEATDLIAGYWSGDVVEVVMVLRAVGERDRATSVVAALVTGSSPWDLRLLARIYARTGEPDLALATARRARELEPHSGLDDAVAGDIAEALEQDGYTDSADAVANTVDGDWARHHTRDRQIQAALSAGAIERARTLAELDDGARDPSSDAVKGLITALVVQGQTEVALHFARGRNDVTQTALARVAVAIAENGDPARAEEIAAEIPDGWGATARREVAATAARGGDHATARAAADRIAVDHIRGVAYGDLAVALQDVGRHADAQRTMADALCAAVWPELIVPLGAIDPDAVHAIADVVLADPAETDRPGVGARVT